MKRREKWLRIWRRFSRRKTALFGLCLIALFFAATLLAPVIVPYEPSDRAGEPFESPSTRHWLGTNDIGVDVFSELVFASRISLTVGLVAAGIIVFVGSAVGLIAGYFGGYVDEALMRVTDLVLILPRLPLMVVMAAYLGPSIWTIILVYSVVGWASVARQIRAQVLSVRESSFIEASRALGAGKTQIITDHVLPNVIGIVLANGVMEIMFAILAESGLSFLGLSDPTHKSWGVMLYFAQLQGAFLRGAWWWIFPPGVCIAALGCAFNFVGTALNDVLSFSEARH
jgi:ABC-type dipeptide/oligopeptide/nickel transport system permease subunit